MGQPLPDIIEGLIAATQPWFTVWMCALVLAVGGCLLCDLQAWLRIRRSPVERMIRRRFG